MDLSCPAHTSDFMTPPLTDQREAGPDCVFIGRLWKDAVTFDGALDAIIDTIKSPARSPSSPIDSVGLKH